MQEIFDVFISYRRSDGQPLARSLYTFLDSKGVRVFLDEVKLLDGDYFDTQLRDKLISAPHYVLIGSSDAFIRRPGEDWVWHEMELAADEFDKAEFGERSLIVIAPYDAKIPDTLPSSFPEKLDRILKAQRIPIPFGVDVEDTFTKVLSAVTRVSKRNLWHSAHKWFENSKRPGGRFAHLHIEDSILPKAGTQAKKSELPVNASIDSKEGDEVTLLEAFESVQDHLFLIGQGGIGKTTALMKLLENTYSVDEKYDKTAPIPIFVELSYAPDNDGRFYEEGKSSFIRRSVFKQIFERSLESQSLLQAVEGEKNAFTISSETAVKPINELFTKKTNTPEYYLLLDGLNEVSTAQIKNKTESVINLIRGEIQYILNECPNVRVILTSRSDDVCSSFGEFKRLYLSGVDEDSIKQYLKGSGMDEEQIETALLDAHLKDTLRIPLFLTMYAVLKNRDGISTQGEILRCFFHERRDNIGIYTVQDRIARIGNHASSSANIMDHARLTVEMQNFIIDLILPEIGLHMEKNGEFHISRMMLREIISKVLDGREDTDLCGICGDEIFKIGNMQGAFREPSMIADEINRVFGSNKNRITASIIECLVYSLGIMQTNTDSSGYGFTHQHIRDFFAAIGYINTMRLAVSLYKDGEKENALSVMNKRFKNQPIGLQVRRFIGEALGEHHNVPYFNNSWRLNNLESNPLRMLLTKTLDIYREVSHDDSGYGIYSLMHILNEVRGELSGMDLSRIDFTGCSLNGMRLSRKGLEARFEKAVLSYKELGCFGHVSGINSASFNPDGNRIVTASDDGTAKIWDARTFELLETIKGNGNRYPVNSARFDPDGKRVVIASANATAKIWDVGSFELIGVFEGHDDWVESACFSPDGKRIVTASKDGTAVIWDTESFELIGVLEGHDDWVESACFSPDGKRIVTASDDETAKIWDAESFELLGVLEGHDNSVESACFSPDGKRIVTASWDKTAKIWDAENFELLGVLKGHNGRLNSACFSPDGKRIVTASEDGTVKIWDAENFELLGVLKGHNGRLNSACFSPDGKRIVTASEDGTATIWDAESFIRLGILKGYAKRVNSACFSPDGKRIVTASEDGTAKTWDAENSELLGVLNGHNGRLSSACFSPDGKRIVTASKDGTATIWDAISFELLGMLNGHDDSVFSACFSPDSKRIITSSLDGTAKIWDAESFKLLNVLNGHDDPVFSACFSPDSKRIVTASWDKTAKIWDAKSFKLLNVLNGHDDPVFSACFSPDSKRIVTASGDGTAKIWDAESFELLGELKRHDDGWPNSVCFSPDSKRIATATSWVDETVKIWDAESFNLLGTLDEHTGSVNSAYFSSDGKFLVTASSDGTAKVWDAATNECLHTVPNIPGLIFAGVDFTCLDPLSVFTDEEKTLLRTYGAEI